MKKIIKALTRISFVIVLLAVMVGCSKNIGYNLSGEQVESSFAEENVNNNEPVSFNFGNNLLEDEANLLTDSERGSIKEKLFVVSQKYNIDVVIVTVNSTDDKSARDFANDYYDYGGYHPDGVVLLIDMGERELHISTTGMCVETLSDLELGDIVDSITPDIREDKYNTAFETFISLVDMLMEEADS